MVALTLFHQLIYMYIVPQELSSEVATLRTSFENLLKSCDLFDTPFDTTKVEADISSLKDKMHHCDKVCSMN